MGWGERPSLSFGMHLDEGHRVGASLSRSFTLPPAVYNSAFFGARTSGVNMKTSLHLLAAAFVAILSACSDLSLPGILPTDEPPGVGEKYEKGYAASAPVIEALEKYRADHDAYPQKLAELVPDYLPAAPGKTDALDFSYSSTGDSYSFSFHYTGPGMNTCTFKPGEDWRCSGAY
jgi:hypothetical protein